VEEGDMTQQPIRPDDPKHAAQKRTPLERFLALPGTRHAKQYPRGYHMLCPAHQDREASLMFWEDEDDGHVGILCFAGCLRADICAALGIRETDLYKGTRSSKPSAHAARKIDLLDLALDKLIHPSLFLALHMEDGYTWKPSGKPAVRNVVRIPYFMEDGTSYRRSRIRTALTAKSGSYWDGEEAPMIPYGLWRLQDARATKTLWLVEGESDCWTHWYHGVPALGIPGARNYNVLEASHLSDIETLYIVQEPAESGKTDAGKGFVDGLCQRLKAIGYAGEVFLVSLKRSHNVKDPNELHKHLFTEGRVRDYADELEKAVHEAVPLDLMAHTSQPEQLAEIKPLVEAAVGSQDTSALYELAPRIARLETKEQASVIAVIKQGMKQASGFSVRAFNKLIKEAAAAHHQGQQQHIRVTHKPDVYLTGDIELDAQAALMAIYTANTPPVIFLRRGKLTRYRKDEEGRPFIEEVNEAILLYEMARSANFLTYSQARETSVPTYPPLAVARYILSQGTWKFPALRGITEVPVVRDDGTILDQPGYDPASRLIYLPHPDLVIPHVPANPTRQEVEQARDLAWGYLSEFPYETRADAANAYALLLTVVIRTLVSLVPMATIDATKQGSGKGLLAKFIAYIMLGRSAAAMVPPNDENEWRKTLTSLTLEGETLISLDNVEGLLYSPTLASFLTADVWKARLLGTMQSPDLVQRTMMIANGNNMQLGGDIPRRAYRIRMDAGVSKPWMRTGFTYSPLLKYAKADRGKIIAALLTLVRAWYAAGQPAPATPVPALAEFSAWAEIVGGILAFAGVDGFLDNLNQLYDETDVEGPQWAGFLEMWQSALGSGYYTTAQIIEKLKQDATFASALPDALAGLPLEETKEIKAFSIKLGRALQKRNGTPYGPDNTRLSKKQDEHSKQKLWSVTSVPVEQAKPVRLVWSRQMDFTQDVPTMGGTRQERERALGVGSVPRSEEESDVAAPLTLSETCEAPECQRGAQEDDGFTYDSYGHAWCHQHANRKRVLEIGGKLKTPFPLLFYARGSRMLEEGQGAWETFVLHATDTAIADVLHALENRQSQDYLSHRDEENTA
jgi:hypothetical protein